MTPHLRYLKATIGQKQLVALTALALTLFVLIHMAGNLLIFVGPKSYNEYSHALVSNSFIYVAEAGLVLSFLCHALVALKLQWLNWSARPQGYAMWATGDKKTTLVSRTMAIQGVIILVFTVIHLITFKYGPEYSVDYGKGPIRDLHKLVLEVFHDPFHVTWYLVALVLLGLHLSHGIKSLMQTWGVHHPHCQFAIATFAWIYALVVSIGFISQPVYVYFFYHG